MHSTSIEKSLAAKKLPLKKHAYYGVRIRTSGKWVSEIRVPGTMLRYWLGTHDTAEMAARTHGMATVAINKDDLTVPLNFPDQTHLLPSPTRFTAEAFLESAYVAAASADGRANALAPSATFLDLEDGDQFGGLLDLPLHMNYVSCYGADPKDVDAAAIVATSSDAEPEGDQLLGLPDMHLDKNYLSWSGVPSAIYSNEFLN
uniref:Uncharacterized protein n=1 Tax=Avena sativa TaxID=4498 RepID=A0ACD5ZKC6_AVESA